MIQQPPEFWRRLRSLSILLRIVQTAGGDNRGRSGGGCRGVLPLVVALACSACGTPSSPPHPDVVFIVVDTLRADSLGAYGGDRGLTPRMDALAARGVVFERAVSAAPWTQPSIASMFSGFYPGVHGVDSYARAVDVVYRDKPRVQVFDDRFVTLAEVLADAGYEAAGFVANPFLIPEFGFGQGFAHYDARFARNTTAGDKVNRAVLDWVSIRDDASPLFLYVHYMDVHGPYELGGIELDRLLDAVEVLPEPTLLTEEEHARLGYLDRPPADPNGRERYERLGGYREYWEARYLAGVRAADRHVGELLDALAARGIGDDAVVMRTADHGESLCEHGMWDHGSTLHEAELHVPWVLRAPGLQPARRTTRVSGIDLMPTLLELLRLAGPEAIQGRSRLRADPVVPGDGPEAFAESIAIGDEQKCLYDGDLKLMLQVKSGAVALYDINVDPAEADNLARSRREQALDLSERILIQARRNASLRPEALAPPVELTPEQRERLESLGYL